MYELSLHKNEVLSDGIIRILNERIEDILPHCAVVSGDIHASIHEIRRNIKKIRAILRLVRDETGYDNYYRENIYFRDLGRLLSEIRTIEILNHSLELARKNIKSQVHNPTINRISETLIKKRNDIIINVIEKQNILEHIALEVSGNRDRLSTLKFTRNDFSTIKPGIKRIYKHCRKYLKICSNNPQLSHLHDFRKKVKYLLCQLQIIYFVFPAMLNVYISSLDSIADNLGIYRDLHELQDFILSDNIDVDERHIIKLISVIETLKSRHLHKAMEKSEIVFSLQTGPFIKQLEKYFEYRA